MNADPIGEMMGDVSRHFEALRNCLNAIDGTVDRRIALDALRDAFDRGSESLAPSQPFLAGSFALEALVHKGPDFEVHRWRQRDLGTLHAVKTVAAEQRDNPLLRDLLLREARHHLGLRHPAILPAEVCLRLGDGRPALLTTWCDAATLGQQLRSTLLGPRPVLELAICLTEGLEAIHAAHLLHLDLSPANILLPSGTGASALIADFGLSLPVGQHRGADDIARAGSSGFTAPEADDPARPLDVRVDLFALGAVLKATLSPEANDPLSGALRLLLDELCRPDPAQRPPSAAALRPLWHRLSGLIEHSS